jgi:hypothetical protein
MGKMTKRFFSQKANRAKKLLSSVYTDVCSPLSTPAKGGFGYFITFIDNCMRYSYVYLMTCKSGSFNKFKEFKAEVER